MRQKLSAIAILAALACAGCVSKDVSGDLDVLENYGNVKPLRFEFQGNTWGILDKPKEGRMLVVSLGAHGALGDQLFERTEAAVHGYLSQTSRVCEIGSKRLMSATDLSVEFVYVCS